jgi:hypothetical protein
LKSYSDIDITHKFCKNCATMYEDLTFKVSQIETESCPLCDFYALESKRITEGTNLVNLILQKSRNLSNRLSNPIEIPKVNDIISITHPESSNFRMFSNTELFEQFQKFFDLTYLQVDKLKYEHSIAEFLYIADQCFKNWNPLHLLDKSTIVKYSLFRYSSLNRPNILAVDEDINCYRTVLGNLGQTREQHLLAHLTVPENQVVNRKSSCKPHILSSDVASALIEVNQLILRLSDPSHVLCLRTLDQGYQLRLYYQLQPALVLLIGDLEVGRRTLSPNNKPMLITCYTTNNMQELLKPMYSDSNVGKLMNFVPDFIGG